MVFPGFNKRQLYTNLSLAVVRLKGSNGALGRLKFAYSQALRNFECF